MNNGYFKLYRKDLENGVIMKDMETLLIWLRLLAEAAYEPRMSMLGGEPIMLEEGQLTLGRKQMELWTGVDESKVQRTLKKFEKAGLIEQRTSNTNRLISIIPRDSMKKSEQQVNILREEKNKENINLGGKSNDNLKHYDNSRNNQTKTREGNRSTDTSRSRNRQNQKRNTGMSIIR